MTEVSGKMPNTHGRQFAEHIEIVRKGDDFSLKINGAEFPWHINTDGASMQVSHDMPSITVTIPTSRISVRDEW